MVKLFRNTVALSDLWVSSNDKLSDFYASSWQRGDSPVPLLLLRVLLSAAAVGILTWSVVEGPSPFWLIFLTNWGLLLVTMMMLSGLLVSCVSLGNKSYESTVLPWYICMYWLLYNVTISIAILITALYWILLYDPESFTDRRMFWLDVSTHGFNSCIAFLEFLFARTPLRILHFYQPLGVGVWYAAFTAVYYVAGGTDGSGNHYIYGILDWKYGKRSGIIIGLSVLGLFAIYTVLWALALCRDKISTSIIRTTSHNLQPTPPADILHTRIV